jgi:hypothetical protein
MFHCQPPKTMRKDQDFPVSIEAQMLGGNGKDDRSTANVCHAGTHIVMNDRLITPALQQLQVADVSRRSWGDDGDRSSRQREDQAPRQRPGRARIRASPSSTTVTQTPRS